MRVRTILVVGLLIMYRIAYAQNLTFYGFLPTINQTGRICPKWNYNFFASTTIDAFYENIGGVEYPATDLQLYIQPSIVYLLSSNVQLAGSYTYQRNNPFNENFVNEHRLWQQVFFSLPASKSRITNRLRLEERFTEDKQTGLYPFSTRTRYQIGFNLPLQGRNLDKHEFYLIAYNEFFLSLTGAKIAAYSEDWAYAGLGYETGKMGRIELGYMLQTLVRNRHKDLRFLNLAQIIWITNFNFHGKKD
ncbi:DUF2490 domain-containing protein [Rhodoflexus caldus]|uniref:DUF2490 domain-containing protein n=1 Tax=Rhodoflexus caldus TaxID=2891236 RepID=UPI00202A663D|nr:DUF2490 domain-containing protein [Rhodoflexus caldus]